jgi:aminoglycoside phosphotransferase (APT) family kinase protein
LTTATAYLPISDSEVRRRTFLAMRAAVNSTILPEVTSPAAITSAHMMLRLLDYLAAAEIADDKTDPALLAAWEKVSGGKKFPDRIGLEAAVADIATHDDEASRNFLSVFYKSELQDVCGLIPETVNGVAELYLGGRKSNKDAEPEAEKAATPEAATPAPLTPEKLTHYLRARFPEDGDVTVKSINVLPGGMSKLTIKIAAERDGHTENFVMRKNLDVSPSARSVTAEFPTISAVWEAGGVPIAKPLWLEADPAKLGTPAMAVEFKEGSGDISSWVKDPAARAAFSESLAKGMASLHAMPLTVSPAGPVDSKPTYEHVADEINRWYTEWQSTRVYPQPVMQGVFQWLLANIPKNDTPPALVHGDIGFHNMLMKNGEVTALLDWEFCHPGDPMEDVVYCRPFVEEVLDWEIFLAAYERHGGRRPDKATERFYSVWRSARNTAGCVGAFHSFLTNDNAEMKLAVVGLTFLRRFELDAFASIVKE